MNTEKMYTLAEVAEELRKSSRTIYNYVLGKRIKTVKIGSRYLVCESELNYIKTNGLREKE